jgi:hypothetical protein
MTVRVPKYRLHKPTGQALVEIRGRRVYLGRHNSPASQEKYRRLIAELMAADASPAAAVAAAWSPAPSAAPPLTVKEAALRYFRHAKRYYVKNGEPTDEVAAIRAALRRLLRMFGGATARAIVSASLPKATGTASPSRTVTSELVATTNCTG